MYLTFDVETRGLYGEAFAVGYVLTTDTGEVVLEGQHACQFLKAAEDLLDTTPLATREFLESCVLPVAPSVDCESPHEVRMKFQQVWKRADREANLGKEDLYLVVDCPFPCEVGFLQQIRKEVGHGSFVGAYPLIDVASMVLKDGGNPIGTFHRTDDEKPAHNPLNDARQSSRILHQLLRGEVIA